MLRGGQFPKDIEMFLTELKNHRLQKRTNRHDGKLGEVCKDDASDRHNQAYSRF